MESPNEKDRWKNRRAMAWWAFRAGLVFPFLMLIPGSKFDSVILPFYTFVTAVVGAYIGFSTIDDKWQK